MMDTNPLKKWLHEQCPGGREALAVEACIDFVDDKLSAVKKLDKAVNSTGEWSSVISKGDKVQWYIFKQKGQTSDDQNNKT